mgnify:FL=1|jgi:release factor glutamine methyltransferase
MTGSGSGNTTVGYLLAAARAALSQANVESPQLDSELLLASVLSTDRAWIIAHGERRVSSVNAATFHELVGRRIEREPVAYIVGTAEFYGMSFLVDDSVLIPRPETEILVSHALRILDENDLEGLALDIGTGSGCVAISVLASLPEGIADVQFHATDSSAEALALAEMNAMQLAVDLEVEFHECDLFPEDEDSEYDLILSNPPYIPAGAIDALEPEISIYEPRAALNGGPDGLRIIQRIIEGAPARLRSGGSLLLEIGAGQSAKVAAMGRNAGFRVNGIHDDLAGLPRVVEFRRK